MSQIDGLSKVNIKLSFFDTPFGAQSPHTFATFDYAGDTGVIRSPKVNRDIPFDARIAVRMPQSLYDKLERWAEQEDRPLANLIYTLVKQAVTEREQMMQARKPEQDSRR